MTAQGRYNDYKRYCTELGFFREVVETTTTEDGVQSSRTMCYCNVEECGRVFVKRDKGGYSRNGTELRPPIASVGTLSMFAHVLYCSLLEACNFVHMHMRTYFIKLL